MLGYHPRKGKSLNRRTYLVLCAVVLVLATGFRWYRLGERSLWLDEARVANYARQSLAENVTKTRLGSSSPVAYPLLLQAVIRVHDSVIAARAIAAVAGVIAVLVLLALPRLGADPAAALIAAAVLAVSPAQIRYAQEVREYSLAVLVATVLTVALLGRLRKIDFTRKLLVAGLFVAPLVQYGLILFGAAVLLVLTWVTGRLLDRSAALREIAPAATGLAVGIAVTVALTLRGHWGHGVLGYLEPFYFGGSILDVGSATWFLASSIPPLLGYLTLGTGSVVLLVPAAGLLLLLRPPRSRLAVSLVALAVASVGLVAVASLARLYPLGPIRQDLFLAPAIAGALGVGWAVLVGRLPLRLRTVATTALLAVVLAAGTFGIVEARPYREVEDIKAVIAGLAGRAPDDLVYVYYAARPAMRYYRVEGPEFVFGHSHRDNPGSYAIEFRELVGSGVHRVWLVFSHTNPEERRLLLRDLGTDWSFESAVEATGAELLLGKRIECSGTDSETGPAGSYCPDS